MAAARPSADDARQRQQPVSLEDPVPVPQKQQSIRDYFRWRPLPWWLCFLGGAFWERLGGHPGRKKGKCLVHDGSASGAEGAERFVRRPHRSGDAMRLRRPHMDAATSWAPATPMAPGRRWVALQAPATPWAPTTRRHAPTRWAPAMDSATPSDPAVASGSGPGAGGPRWPSIWGGGIFEFVRTEPG